METKLKEIIDHYGVASQQKKLAEEVFELQEAIKNYQDFDEANSMYEGDLYTIPKFRDDIIEEMADVFVLLNQFIVFYKITDEELNSIIKYKVNRQLERINKE